MCVWYLVVQEYSKAMAAAMFHSLQEVRHKATDSRSELARPS